MTTKKTAAVVEVQHDEYLEDTRRQKISISIDCDLLKRVDAYSKRHGLNRSALFSIGVSMFMDNELRRRE